MDMVRFTCTGCGKRIKAEARLAGRTGRCPGCGSQFVVPARDATRLQLPTPTPPVAFAAGSAEGLPNSAPRRGGSWRRRKFVVAAASTVLAVTLLTWWVAVKDELFPAEPATAAAEARSVMPHQFPSTPFTPTVVGHGAAPGTAGSLLAGTFETPPEDDFHLSITFEYPRYHLNPSRSVVWTVGTEGSWDLWSDHPLLTEAQRSDGWLILTMAAPDDPTTPMPSRVRLGFDAAGQANSLQMASFLGITFEPDEQMVMRRTDAPAARPSPPPESTDVIGLARAGYARGRCLICDGARSVSAMALHGDRQGYGLCERCGTAYDAWARALKGLETGVRPTSSDQVRVDEFRAILEERFERGDDPGRRGMGLVFLVGKFGSAEWDALTRGY